MSHLRMVFCIALVIVTGTASNGEDQVKYFRVSGEKVALSDTAIHILIEASCETEKQATDRFLNPQEQRLVVMRVEIPESPFEAIELRRECWLVPDYAAALPVEKGESIARYLRMEPNGDLNWRHQRGADYKEYDVWYSRAQGKPWTKEAETVRISNAIKGIRSDGQNSLSLIETNGSSSVFLSTRRDGVEVPHEWKNVRPEFLKLLRDEPYSWDIMQDGVGAWCQPQTIAKKKGPVFIGEVRIERNKQYVVCLLDDPVMSIYSPPVSKLKTVDSPSHMCISNDGTLLTTFGFQEDGKYGAIIQEIKGEKISLGPAIWLDHPLYSYSVRFLKDKDLFIAVGLIKSVNAYPTQVGQRRKAWVEVHFWNHRTGKHVVKEISIGDLIWYDENGKFQLKDPVAAATPKK